MSTPPSLQAVEPAAVERVPHGRAVTGSRRYWRINLALFLAGLSTFSLLYCVQPLLPLLAQRFAVSATQSSLALSLSTGCLAGAILFAGAWSAGADHRRLMFWSMVCAAGANLLASQSPPWAGVLAARALVGLCMGGVPAVAMAYLAEHVESRGLGLSTGLYVGGTAFGGMMGRVGMGLLLDRMDWRPAMLVLSLTDLAVALGFLLLLPADPPEVGRSADVLGTAGTPGTPGGPGNPGGAMALRLTGHLAIWRMHLAQPALRLLFATAFLGMGFFVTLYNYAGFHLQQAPFNLSVTHIGLIFCAYVFGMVAAPMAGGLADRHGQAPVLLAGCGVAVSGILLLLVPQLPVFILGVVLVTIGFFMAHATASGWVGRLAQGYKGHATALYLLAYYGGSSLLGTAGGRCWQALGWPGVCSYALLLVLGMALLGVRLRWLVRQAARSAAVAAST